MVEKTKALLYSVSVMDSTTPVYLDKMCSKCKVSDSAMNDYVQLQDSFSYDCGKYFNLAIIEDTIIFSAGNLLHLLDTKSGLLTFKRSEGGNGIGHITTNQKFQHVTVGESGDGPSIFIYLWPNFELVNKLENGTEKSYAYLDYSPDGEILCSQGTAPDYTLALWNWRRGMLLMRCHPSTQPVHRAAFSRMQPDIIITCGYSHIGFWRTAKTFTGLKLTGEVGRFGATEASDVVNFECLEDGKVASGCEWGNILIWGGAAIEREICTRRDVTCHSAPVFAFHRHKNNLVSIGSDGWVRIWELNGGCRIQENSKVLRKQEALIYFSIGDHARLLSKVDLPSASPGSEVWFLQDGNGALWRAEVGAALEGYEAAPAVTRLLRCHSTSVVALAACPHDTQLATLAKNGRLLVYDYMTRQVLERECGLPASALLWLPVQMDDSGSRVVVGFECGAVSICSLVWGAGVIRELQAWRPHSERVTTLSASAVALATASRDRTVFLFSVQSQPRLSLVPRGYICTPAPAVSLQWHPHQSGLLLVFSENGEIQEFKIAEHSKPTLQESLKLDLTANRTVDLTNLGLVVRSENEEQVTEEKFIVTGRYKDENTLSVVVKGKLNFVVCEIDLVNNVVISSHEIPGTSSASVSSASFTPDCENLLLGFDSGEVQFCMVEPDVTWRRYWRLSMHEGALGSYVTDVIFSFDHNHFFSCGVDGNVFVFRLIQAVGQPPTVILPTTAPDQEEKRIGIPVKNLTLTLEEICQLKEEKRKAVAVKNKRADILKRLEKLKEEYKEIKEMAAGKEELLPLLPKCSEELHPTLMQHLQTEVSEMRTKVLGEVEPILKKSEAEWSAIYKHFLSDIHTDSLKVFGFSEDIYVCSYRLKKLDEKMLEEYAEMEKKLDEESSCKSSLITESISTLRTSLSSEPSSAQESTEKPEEITGPCSTLALERMRQRFEERRKLVRELEKILADKPPSTPDPELYEQQIREAEENIGDFKLKCEPGYRVPHDQRPSTLRTKHQRIEVKLKIFTLKDEFNREVFELKARKNLLISRYIDLKKDNEPIRDNEVLKEKMKLREDELPEQDLLKLCGGKGSDFGVETSLGGDFYAKVKTGVALLAAMARFDQAMRAQYEARIHLDVRVCMLELRANSLKKELLVLEELEPQDHELTERLREAREKKLKLQDGLSIVSDNIKKRKKSLLELTRLEKDIERRFHCQAETSSFYDPLTILFKIKYRPPSLSIGSSATESSHESEASSETGDTPHSTARKRRPGISERVCPPGCDPGLFELTNALRVERYELNLKIDEERKDLELMKKDHEITIKKIKLVNNAIRGILEEIDVFEQDRQGRLNALVEVVPLSLHQIPADERLSNCVVMPRVTLERLQRRAGELKQETAQLEEQLAEDKRKLKNVKLQTVATEKEIIQLKEKIEETMLKRFGKIINLEELETFILNVQRNEKGDDEIILEKEMRVKISKLKKDVSTLKAEINQGLKEKAKNMKLLATLMKENNDLNEKKVNRHEQCKRGRGSPSLQHLHEVMTSQREQISSLRHELAMLRCKMTSSRDLFPSTRPPSAVTAAHSEGSEVTVDEQTPPPSRQRRGSMLDHTSSTPEILIEHCQEEEEEEDQTNLT